MHIFQSKSDEKHLGVGQRALLFITQYS